MSKQSDVGCTFAETDCNFRLCLPPPLLLTLGSMLHLCYHYLQEQEETYNFLLAVYEKVLESLKDGAQLSSVYAAAMKHIEQTKPELLEHFTKTAG